MDGNLQSGVLRCGMCNKPFDKPSTLKKHGYYCRSRRVGPQATTRSRSCIACAKRKARCDNRQPGCSRCLSKGVECRYPDSISARRQRPSTHDHTPSLVTGTEVSSHTGSTQEVGDHNDGDGSYNNALVWPDSVSDPLDVPGVAIAGDDYIAWNQIVPEVGLDDFHFLDIAPQIGEDNAYMQSFSPQRPISTPTILPRLLIFRPSTRTGDQRTTTLIMHNLKSYLLMLLRDSTLPPFIHPSSTSLSEFGEDHSHIRTYHPLAMCLSLTKTLKQSFKSKGRRAFWDNVRGECERLINSEHYQGNQKLGRWDLLGAMQALSVYILIRLDEGETEDNNVDFLLLGAVTTVARQLSAGDELESRNPISRNDGLHSGWEEWVFEESRRRVTIIYRIIRMLAYFEPAAKCDLPADLILAPLPAKKPLWEAKDEVTWEVEAASEPGLYQTAFGLAITGDLVRLNKGQVAGPLNDNDSVLSHTALDANTVSRSTADWEEWCSGMDGFGGLVMLAASLVA